MKRLSAIVLSLLLFWVQVFVMAQPIKADAPTTCCGCACKKSTCCVAQSSTPPAPLPVAPAPTGAQDLSSFSITASLAWTLPRSEADLSPAYHSPLQLAPRVPLFRRDCALLI